MRRTGCVLVIALLSWPIVVHAEALECISAHADGQVLRKSGKFQAARQKFTSCASDACPALIKKDCVSFEAELEAAQPSLTVIAKSVAGRELAIAALTIDDNAAPTPNPALLDAGQHRVSVSLADGRRTSATVVMHEAEKSNLIVTFKDVPRQSGPVPTASYVLGGVGVVALGSFAYFGLRGRAKENSFDDCSKTHTCPVPEVREMRHLYLAADVSLSVSLISLGLGSYLLARHMSDEVQQKQALSLNVVAVPGAYLLGAAGHF